MKFNTGAQDPKKMNSNEVDDSTCYFTCCFLIKYVQIYNDATLVVPRVLLRRHTEDTFSDFGPE